MPKNYTKDGFPSILVLTDEVEELIETTVSQEQRH